MIDIKRKRRKMITFDGKNYILLNYKNINC